MAPPKKERFLREYVRGLLISLVMGLGIAAFMYLTAPGFFGVRIFGYGALIGVLISSACMLLEHALEAWLSKREPIIQKLSRAVIYFVGGNAGWFAAAWIATELSLVHPQIWAFGRKMLLFNGVIAVVIGFVFYGFGVMRQRLRENVEQLKEHEFAQKELELARFIQQRPLELSNAGLPDPYLLREGALPVALSVPGPRLPLGLRRGIAYESLAVELSVGDRALFLTDGLPEAPTSRGEPLGYEALGHLLPADGHAPGRSLDDLLDRVRLATSETLEDDWTVLLLEHKGIAGSLAS